MTAHLNCKGYKTDVFIESIDKLDTLKGLNPRLIGISIMSLAQLARQGYKDDKETPSTTIIVGGIHLLYPNEILAETEADLVCNEGESTVECLGRA